MFKLTKCLTTVVDVEINVAFYSTLSSNIQVIRPCVTVVRLSDKVEDRKRTAEKERNNKTQKTQHLGIGKDRTELYQTGDREKHRSRRSGI